MEVMLAEVMALKAYSKERRLVSGYHGDVVESQDGRDTLGPQEKVVIVPT